MAMSLVGPTDSCRVRSTLSSVSICSVDSRSSRFTPVIPVCSSRRTHSRPATYLPCFYALKLALSCGHSDHPARIFATWRSVPIQARLRKSSVDRDRNPGANSNSQSLPVIRDLNPWLTSNSHSSLVNRDLITSATSNSQSSETAAMPAEGRQSADDEGPSAQSHMDLLERLTSDNSNSAAGKTIAEQLAADLGVSTSEEATVPLGSGKLDMGSLTVAQRRNIRRQNYLNEVAKRNDAPLFTAVALFVIVPPAAILGVAIATGYVELFP